MPSQQHIFNSWPWPFTYRQFSYNREVVTDLNRKARFVEDVEEHHAYAVKVSYWYWSDYEETWRKERSTIDKSDLYDVEVPPDFTPVDYHQYPLPEEIR